MKRLWNENWMFLKTKVDAELSDLQDRWQEFCDIDMPHDWLIYDTLNLYEDSTGWYWKKFDLDVENGKKYFSMKWWKRLQRSKTQLLHTEAGEKAKTFCGCLKGLVNSDEKKMYVVMDLQCLITGRLPERNGNDRR